MARYSIHAKTFAAGRHVAGRIVGYTEAPIARVAVDRWIGANPAVGYAASDLIAKRMKRTTPRR